MTAQDQAVLSGEQFADLRTTLRWKCEGAIRAGVEDHEIALRGVEVIALLDALAAAERRTVETAERNIHLGTRLRAAETRNADLVEGLTFIGIEAQWASMASVSELANKLDAINRRARALVAAPGGEGEAS